MEVETVSRIRSIYELVDPSRHEGYDAFQELIAFGSREDMPEQTRRSVIAIEIMTVAVVETANKLCDDLGIGPDEALVEVWDAAGAAMSILNLQCMDSGDRKMRARRAFRTEMLKMFKAGYDRGVVAWDKNEPGDEEAKQ
jgi:hypothetical protein